MIDPEPTGDGFGLDYHMSSRTCFYIHLITIIMCGKIKKLTLVLVVFLTGQWAVAQVLVSGKVLDQQSGEALPGVNISILNALSGTVTDLKGEFSVEVQDASAVLSFSSIGYLSQQIQAESNNMTVLLHPSLLDLGRVVVCHGQGCGEIVPLS